MSAGFRRRGRVPVRPFALLAFVCLIGSAGASESEWPSWRGPLGTGASTTADPPLRWSENQNVRWKTRLPGRGHSSPVVWGDRVYVTTSIPHGPRFEPIPETAPGAHDNVLVSQRHRFVVLAVDRESGEIVWQTDVREALPHEGGHVSATLASPSPWTDGKHVFASFGSYGVHCLTRDGELVWQRDLGTMKTKHGHGEGSSLALASDLVILNWDHEAQSFLIALDKVTGETRWKVLREEVTSWSSPLIVQSEETAQVIVAGTNRVRGYLLESGEEQWQCGGLSHNVVATPVANGDLVFIGSSYEKRAMLAIRWPGARGEVTSTDRVVWSRRQRTPYVPSPLLTEEALYFLNHYQGVLTRVDPDSGDEPTGPFRLRGIGEVYASPVSAAGRIYFVDRDGTTVIVADDPSVEVLATNQLEDSFSATPALSGPDLFLRGEQFLYCLSKESDVK